MLSYQESAPPPELRPFIRCIWSLHGEAEGPPERILPDGTFELVFHGAAPFREGETVQPGTMLMGQIRKPVVVHPTGVVDVRGVRFRIGGASAFFDFPMAEARDRMIDLSLIQVRVRARARRDARRVAAAVDLIERSCGDVRVREIVRIIGTTERTLERAFHDVVGLSPKQLCRVVRFQSSLKSEERLAFYDQSHHIHEFHALAGVTPTEFWRERHAIQDAFVGNLQS